MFEGYCFWYADIVLNRRLRIKLPDGEFAFTRSAISSPHFHPFRAFEALGLKNNLEILEVYLAGFAGYESALYKKKSQSLFTADLFKIINGFYTVSLKPLAGLKQELDSVNIFTDFRDRFCNVPGLPGLLPSKLLRTKFTEDPYNFCHRVYLEGMPAIAKLSQSYIQRVLIRREIQTRAYSASVLLGAFRTDRIYFPKPVRPSEKAKTEEYLEEYLHRLEEALRSLAQNKSTQKAEAMFKAADILYKRKVFDFVRKKNLWISKRTSILPSVDTPLNFLNPGAGMNPNNRRALHNFAEELAGRLLKKSHELKKDRAELQDLQLKLANLLKQDVAVGRSRKGQAAWIRAFNDLMKQPLMLKGWSVRLDAIDPSQNQFRELLFIYE